TGAEIRRRRTGPAEAEAAHRLNAAHEEAVTHREPAPRFVSVRHAEPGARGEDGAPDDGEIPHRVRDVLVEVVAPAQRAAGKLQRKPVPRARARVKIDVPRVAGYTKNDCVGSGRPDLLLYQPGKVGVGHVGNHYSAQKELDE